MNQAPKPITPPISIPITLFQMAAVFFLAGFAGITALVLFTLPFLFPRWLLYFSLFLAFTGATLPIAWYLNRRFSASRFPTEGVLLREALEAASLGVFLVWLQAGRMFTPFLGWIFFAAFLVVELLLRVYEQSRWSPTPPEEDADSTGFPIPAGDDKPPDAEAEGTSRR